MSSSHDSRTRDRLRVALPTSEAGLRKLFILADSESERLPA
jgi:hypothetical protein